MNPRVLKLKSVVLALSTLLLLAGLAFAQTTVNLTAQRMSTTLPDGKTVPMWGFCTTGSCTTAWAPGPTIVVPASSSSLTVHLTNHLPTPTSFVILGQIGGSLGQPVKVPSPAHATQTQTTWPANTAASFTPPAQSSRAESFAPEAAAGSGTQTYTWSSLNPGTYLYETGTNPSIQEPMGLYGVLVVTTAPVSPAAGQAYPGATVPGLTNVPYDSDAVVLLSEFDAKQNAAVDALAAAAGAGTINTASYPPAVNYAPTYFLINGKSFDATNPTLLSPVGTAATSGNVVLRFANAGLKTHIPSVVGQQLTLIAEDGNVAPGNAKIQSEVLLPAGKTFDVLIHPAATAGVYATATYKVFDRGLFLSTNNQANGGLQAFLPVAGATNAGVAAQAVADPYTVPVNVKTFSDNVLTNDIGIHSAAIKTAPAHGTVVLNLDGSFTYTSSSATIVADAFAYCGNGGTTLCANVTLSPIARGAAPVANGDSYTSKVSTLLKVAKPGVLLNDTDPTGYVLQAKPDPAHPLPAWVSLNTDGSFTATAAAPGTYSFNYLAVNSQGTASSTAVVSVTFPTPSGLVLTVKDALNQTQKITDYRWIIEQDMTYKNGLTYNNGPAIANTLGVNFHKSYMPVVATGCTGPISCGAGQSYIDAGGVERIAPLQTQTTVAQVALDPTLHYFVSILPGDAANPFVLAQGAPCTTANAALCGHTIGASPIGAAEIAAKAVTVLVEPNPLPTAQLSIFIFEDNNPTNGDIDGTEESQGLGGFNIIINDVGGRTGDPIGQMTYDTFNMPLTNALIGMPGCPAPPANIANSQGSTSQGMIITCPNDPVTGPGHPSAAYSLAGQALVKNLMPGRFDVIAHPSAEREGKGETWIQVSTLEGTPGQDAFAKAGEPAYFQEFGPPGFHTFIGFVNPAHLNAANTNPGTNTITGTVVNEHMSRPSAETNYAGSHAPLSATLCYVGLNSQSGNGPNIAFSQCDANGNFTLTKVPDGSYNVVIWDQWLDQIIDYQSVTVPDPVTAAKSVNMGNIMEFSWFTRVETNTFLDLDGTHKPSANNPGIGQVPFFIRFRDGSISNVLKTDSDGTATFNELFPLFNWYVAESDTTRYKGSGVHVVVDGGGAPDATGPFAGVLDSKYPPYDANGHGTGPLTERIDPGTVLQEGVQGFISQTEILDWGKVPYAVGQNGGINGMVVYASTRPFDDPALIFQNIWAPAIPRVVVNLYQETTAADNSQLLKLVNTTTTQSWDDWVSSGRMSCPGQDPADPFVAQTLGSGNLTRCYDGFHNWNQVQPAVYDGRYYFTTLADGVTPLPAGKYVVEVIPPSGYELVKEEDKNILIGDAWVAPVTQQFGGLSNIFILPDQATIGAYNNNPNNPNNPTTDMGHPSANLQFPPCVGDVRRVPDYISLFPGSGQVAPFAGADRALCDRKEVTLGDQMQANADFFLFTSAPIASHFTGMILNDASPEFNTVSPDYGEKASVPFVPVSIRDFNGIEIQRTYSDQWGMFNGMTPSTWQVNVPNPAGYAPNMLITCMNDPGPILDPAGSGKMITDPQFNPMFSDFCYTNPFMPGLTDYLDTPVLPLAAFASGYTQTDCSYPDTTPGILRVDSSAGFGPYLTTAGGTLTITAIGDQVVPNPAYAGPSATAAPFNLKTITRHYGFGSIRGSGTVTLGGVPLTVSSWTDTSIIATVPANAAGGELIITAGNGKSTVDAVTVTVENKTPTRVQGAAGQTIQAAMDAATPGDLILVDAGTYNELLIMWKPVRLQGVGASSVLINAAKYPTTKLAIWRPRINQLFAIDANGNQTGTAQVDPLPGQEITGGVIILEPSVLGTEEGAGITVLAKNLPAGQCTGGAASTIGSPITASNFLCAASRIDGLSVTGGDAGGGIYVNGWAHNLVIANNRVFGNAGGFNGGVRIGVPYLEAPALNAQGLFGFDQNVSIHHNAITKNGMVEANAGAAGAGGGLSLCSGTDNYRVNYNFICGNYSMGDGGGIGHIGMSEGGIIANNQVLFNQSFIQGGTVHGGGIVVEGEPPAVGALTLGAGDVTIDSNLIQGNFAEAGHGGGIRLQDVNGADAARGSLYTVNVTNNIIINNAAGWAGGGIALRDTVHSNIINNTIADNDSSSIVGPLFGNPITPSTTKPNPAGISTEATSPALLAALSPTVRVAQAISNPVLNNNILWQNRSFFFDISTGAARICPSNGGTTCTPLPAQSTVGQCVAGAKYWDLGVVGDASVAPGARKLNPTNSILTSATGYTGTGNLTSDPNLTASYCNGGPGFGGSNQLVAVATLDEGGNFVDMLYGPLSVSNPTVVTAPNTARAPLADAHLLAGSPAIDTGSTNAPTHDFFGNIRPEGAGFDIGANEFIAANVPRAGLSPASIAFGNVAIGFPATSTVTLSNTGTATLTGITLAFTGPYARPAAGGTCATTLAAGATCTILVQYSPTLAGASPGTLTVTDNDPTLQRVTFTGTGVVAVQSATLVAVTNANFGTVTRGAGILGQQARVFTLTSTGTIPLTGVAASITGPSTDYSIFANTCTATVAPGASCFISVRFAAKLTDAANSTQNATLRVVDGAATSPQTIALTGTAR